MTLGNIDIGVPDCSISRWVILRDPDLAYAKQLVASATPCKIPRPKMQETARWQFTIPRPRKMLHVDAQART